jgi:hypothetical protein
VAAPFALQHLVGAAQGWFTAPPQLLINQIAMLARNATAAVLGSTRRSKRNV